MTKSICKFLSAVVVLLGALSPAVQAVTYTVTDLGPGPVGYVGAMAAGAGDTGIVGFGRKLPEISADNYALLWASGGVVELHPAGYSFSRAAAIYGDSQVGYAENRNGASVSQHAFLWHGSAASAVNLTPQGIDRAEATGVWGGQQVGRVMASGAPYHAALWSGSADSFVDLHPAGFAGSSAHGVANGQQVGSVSLSMMGIPYHAALWRGAADTFVDLHPAGYEASGAEATDGTQQAGYAMVDVAGFWRSHAMLWNGSAASAIDLNPAGVTESGIHAMWNGLQAGWGRGPAIAADGSSHPLLWAGSAESVIDLQQFLPSHYISASVVGFLSDGSIVGTAFPADFGSSHVVIWSPVPEPATTILLLLGLACTRGIRRK